jgi:hypothetical protein
MTPVKDARVAADASRTRKERRCSERVKVFKPADLLINGVKCRSHILNVSATGSMIHTPTSILVGTMIRICTAGLDRHGVIVWKNGLRFGLRFNRSMAMPQMLALQAEIGQA